MFGTDVFGLFTTQAQKFGEKCAVRFGSHTISYSRLLDAVERLASALLKLEVVKGDRFAIMLPNVPQFVIGYLALLRLGVTAVLVDPGLDDDALQSVLRRTGPKGIIALDRFASRIDAAAREAGELRHRIYLGDPVPGSYNLTQLLTHADHADVPWEVSETDPAVIYFTAGTTGLPKGVQFSHNGLLAKIYSIRYTLALTSGHTMFCLSTFAHAFWNLVNLLSPLMSGSELILFPRFDLNEVEAAFQEHANIIVFESPRTLQQIARLEQGAVPKDRVALCISTSRFLSKRTAGAWRDKFGVAVLNSYGITEAGPLLTLEDPWETAPTRRVGTPCYGVQLKLADLYDNGQPLPLIGELMVKSSSLMQGYVGDTTGDTRIDPNGWLCTSDVGSLDDQGRVFLLGRKRDVIVKGGFPVLPYEVESVIASHPKVKTCRVNRIPSDTLGEDFKVSVVPMPGSGLSPKEVVRFLSRSLQGYKRPKQIEIVDVLN